MSSPQAPAPQALYTVFCTLPDEATAESYLRWLRDEHMADLCAVGALDARAVRLDTEADGGAIRFAISYRFASREAFHIYERDHAPRLRAEGLARFPAGNGISYERSFGEILAEHSA